MTELRWVWSRLNANYWFYPALFAIVAGALAVLTVYLDRSGFAQGLNKAGWIMPARPGGASDMLTVIAGSMIGVASTVFSITIAAVAYASGNYGPRLLTNFMEDRGNQLSLATFIGTFVYAVIVLRSVRGDDHHRAERRRHHLAGFRSAAFRARRVRPDGPIHRGARLLPQPHPREHPHQHGSSRNRQAPAGRYSAQLPGPEQGRGGLRAARRHRDHGGDDRLYPADRV
jgi:hypothetical protein